MLKMLPSHPINLIFNLLSPSFSSKSTRFFIFRNKSMVLAQIFFLLIPSWCINRKKYDKRNWCNRNSISVYSISIMSSFFARDFDKQTRYWKIYSFMWNMISSSFFNYFLIFNVLDAWDIANLGDIISYSIVEDFCVLEKYWGIWGWILDRKFFDLILFEDLCAALCE